MCLHEYTLSLQDCRTPRHTSTTAKPLLLDRQSAASRATSNAWATLPVSRLAAFDRKASSSGCSAAQDGARRGGRFGIEENRRAKNREHQVEIHARKQDKIKKTDSKPSTRSVSGLHLTTTSRTKRCYNMQAALCAGNSLCSCLSPEVTHLGSGGITNFNSSCKRRGSFKRGVPEFITASPGSPSSSLTVVHHMANTSSGVSVVDPNKPVNQTHHYLSGGGLGTPRGANLLHQLPLVPPIRGTPPRSPDETPVPGSSTPAASAAPAVSPCSSSSIVVLVLRRRGGGGRGVVGRAWVVPPHSSHASGGCSPTAAGQSTGARRKSKARHQEKRQDKKRNLRAQRLWSCSGERQKVVAQEGRHDIRRKGGRGLALG